MKKYIILSACLILAVHVIQAQTETPDPAKKTEIKNLFSIMHQDSLIVRTMRTMSATVIDQVTNQFKSQGNDSSSIFNDSSFISAMKGIMTASMEQSKVAALRLVNEDMVDIYAKYFTMGQIEDFSRFYKSSSGQVLLDKMPDITKDVMTVMYRKYTQGIQQDVYKKIMALVTDKANAK